MNTNFWWQRAAALVRVGVLRVPGLWSLGFSLEGRRSPSLYIPGPSNAQLPRAARVTYNGTQTQGTLEEEERKAIGAGTDPRKLEDQFQTMERYSCDHDRPRVGKAFVYNVIRAAGELPPLSIVD